MDRVYGLGNEEKDLHLGHEHSKLGEKGFLQLYDKLSSLPRGWLSAWGALSDLFKSSVKERYEDHCAAPCCSYSTGLQIESKI